MPYYAFFPSQQTCLDARAIIKTTTSERQQQQQTQKKTIIKKTLATKLHHTTVTRDVPETLSDRDGSENLHRIQSIVTDNSGLNHNLPNMMYQETDGSRWIRKFAQDP
jgi:hypothetical protein